MMGRLTLRKLAGDEAGSFTIETALIAPVLMMLGFGAFETGSVVAKQHRMQSAAAEAETVALAAAQGATVDVATIRDILAVSTGLPASKITVTRKFRCGDSSTLVNDPVTCTDKDPDVVVSSYLHLELTDTYTPFWRSLGMGQQINLHVQRTVMLS